MWDVREEIEETSFSKNYEIENSLLSFCWSRDQNETL